MNADPIKLRERLPARPQSVGLLRTIVSDFAAGNGASERQRAAVALAVSEAVSNAVVHAYAGRDDPGVVAVDAEICDRTLRVAVCDDGGGMRPRIDSPGLGLGLGLIARLSDQLELTETTPGVCVRMTFALE